MQSVTPAGDVTVQPTSGLAIASLVFGITAWVVLPFVGAVVAVVCGHMARAEIRRSTAPLAGDGFAVGGLVLGYVHLALCVLAVAFLILVVAGVVGMAWFNA